MNLEELFAVKQETPALPDAPGGFVIYGAGSAGRDVCKILEKKKLAVSCFIDRDAEKLGPIEGKKVLTLDAAAGMGKNGMCAVAGMFNGFVNSAEILEKLALMGFKKVLSFYELYRMMPEEFGDRYFLAPGEFFRKNRGVIMETEKLWADEKSKELYARIVAFRYTADMKYSPAPEKNGFNYFPGDIPGWDAPKRLIDCGAFTGDTLLDIRKHYGRLESIAAFEPDGENFKKLSQAVSVGDMAEETRLFRRGVFSSAAELRFSAELGGGSRIDGSGAGTIQAVSLDGELPGYEPDMIKMDIEGAEPEAIKGAENMIKKYSPALAISVYHAPGHMWEIPRLLAGLNPGYRFYLRVYNFHTFDTVLHAVKS
jgi:FkbM family methyltransferase